MNFKVIFAIVIAAFAVFAGAQEQSGGQSGGSSGDEAHNCSTSTTEASSQS